MAGMDQERNAMASDTHPRLQRIAHLERKLASRDGKPGYERNCEELAEQIANLKRAHAGDPEQAFDL
jgi:hypothetical protein